MAELKTIKLLLEKLVRDYYGDNIKTNPALIQLLKELQNDR